MRERTNGKQIEQLIDLCSAHLWQGEVDEQLSLLAIHNGVAAWCYWRLQNGHIKGVNESVLKQWKSVYFQNTLQFQRNFAAFLKAKSILEQYDIPLLALKGIALASGLFADDGLRPMSDVDILVPEGQGKLALEILLKEGAVPLVVPRSSVHEDVDAHVRAIKVDGVMLEVHQRLFTLGSVYHTPQIDFFEHTKTYRKYDQEVKCLDDEAMVYHLVAHLQKGMQIGGLRLGWLLDIALILQGVEKLDTFIEKVITFKPDQRESLLEVFKMALLFMPEAQTEIAIDRQALIDRITWLMQEHDQHKLHRFVNLQQLIKVPGLSRKMQLVWYEFFPQKAYMKYRYGAETNLSVCKMYLKRIFRK